MPVPSERTLHEVEGDSSIELTQSREKSIISSCFDPFSDVRDLEIDVEVTRMWRWGQLETKDVHSSIVIVKSIATHLRNSMADH